MNWLKHNPLFSAMLPFLVAVLALEGWLWVWHHGQAREALAVLAQKQQERDGLVRQSPELSEENAQAVARDLANTQEVLAALRAAWRGGDGQGPAAPPAQGLDLFFAVAAFGEKSRALAARTRVRVRPDEQFGFASHTHEGPGTGLVPAVFRQLVGGQFLTESLLEARPHSLLAIRRERPLPAGERARPDPPPPGTLSAAPDGSGGRPEDFFELDPALSVRVPGQVDSDAFRLEFTGQTAALRTFLNTLATSRRPVIVRSVEVEPLAAGEFPGDPVAPPVMVGTTVPLVAQKQSRFSVVVEVVQLMAATEPVAP